MGKFSHSASQVSGGSVVSVRNSSTTVLTNGSTFTGEWEDVLPFDSAIVSVATDQSGYYSIQYSPDGVNVDATLTRYHNLNEINVPHRFTNGRRYFRVTFTNDSGSNQTYFRLQTLLKVSAQNLNIPLDGIMSRDYDAISVRPTDYTTEVALGLRQGHTTWNKFGYNEDVSTGAAEVVASFGGAFNQKLSSGETLDIVSTSTDDDADPAGSGVRQVLVIGVDSNWAPLTEVVDLNGTTAVTTSGSFLGVNRMTVYTSGTGTSNVGTITATATSSGNTMAQMPAGQGVTQQCIFYVPANHQFLGTWLYLNGIKSSGGGNPEVSFYAYVYSALVDAQFEVFRGSEDTSVSESIVISPAEPFVIGEKSILWLEATTTANSTSVRGRFSGKLVKDADAD